MAQDYTNELSTEQREKLKKNLVYIAIFSIVMVFAGFTSAYIVSMGDTFWVKYPLPKAFWISTITIILSSLFYVLAIKAAKSKNASTVKLWMLLTFIFGLGFAFFQWKGYGQLVEEGAHFRSSIFVVDGRYGDYFEVKYKGKFIQVNGNEFLWQGKEMSKQDYALLQNFVKPFENTADPKGYSIQQLAPNFELYYQNEPVKVEGGQLIAGAKILQYTDMRRLQFLAWNIRDHRGDFFHKGRLGKDFHVFYKGKELAYQNRDLMYNQRKLSAPLQLKANQSRDTATSYLYIITVLHLLHIIGASFYLLKMVFISFKPDLDEKKILSMRLGAIFWHFLGALWIYLLLFLIYIH